MRKGTVSGLVAAIVVIAVGPDHTRAEADTNAVPGGTGNSKAGRLHPGEVASFRTAGAHAVAYHVYCPASFDAAQPPPMVVGFSAGGNGMGILQSFRDAAESMGWIGVGCDVLRNRMDNHDEEIEIEDELLDDILATIPHDPRRVYLTGNSGGAMRSYGITARRPERYAGIIAHGGWLGGPEYQDKPYPAGMAIAMINGNFDMGAGAWTLIDTKTLRDRGCTVKRFVCLGGHVIAPAPVTLLAMQWLDAQWSKDVSVPNGKIALDILYVGRSPERRTRFTTFLEAYFQSVRAVDTAELSLEQANRADVLVLDEASYVLPDNHNKAMLLIGPAAIDTGRRYGSKADASYSGKGVRVTGMLAAHPVFQTPFEVARRFVDPASSSGHAPARTWTISNNAGSDVLLARTEPLETAGDSEIIATGTTLGGAQGALLFREAHRLFWGDNSAPDELEEEARKTFVNALVWIHGFDGARQIDFNGLTPRDAIVQLVDTTDLRSDDALRWFPAETLATCNYEREVLRDFYARRLPYVFTRYGSGQLRIDPDAEAWGTPNNDPASIPVWIERLSGSQRREALEMLIRYTDQRIRNPEAWQAWYATNQNALVFSDGRGYRFFPQSGIDAQAEQ